MNLLIVDDDTISNFVNTRVAQKSGLFSEIRSVNSGMAALSVFIEVCNGTAEAPDIVLLDLHMPGMNGFDFIEALKGFAYPHKERLTIVILTSSDHKGDMDRANAMGIKHYLMKSLSLQELQATIFSLYNKAQDVFRDNASNDINPSLTF